MKFAVWSSLLILGVSPLVLSSAWAYDPAVVVGVDEIATRELSVTDASRKREIPLLVYLPKETKAAPVVLFSHGLGGSKEGSAFLGKHWAARGYVAVFMQHAGSDSSLWKDVPAEDRLANMKAGASVKNFSDRVQDVPTVLDQLTLWNKAEGHPLKGRLDLDHVGMSGHSFGAVTTQAVSGQAIPLVGPKFTDPRIKAAIPFSPSIPRRGEPKAAFGAVKIPWLLMTGTKDAAKINDITPESRLEVYPALPPGSKYELVLDGAEHSVFTERSLPGESGKRNPNHHRVILALSTAFWDAYLRDDAQAKAWLDGDDARKVLEKADRWQRK